MFAKREDWQVLDRSELLRYFNDCGHFPAQQQVDDVWGLVHRGEELPFPFFFAPPFISSSLFSSLVLSFFTFIKHLINTFPQIF